MQDVLVEEKDFLHNSSRNTPIHKISQNKDFFLIKKTGYFVKKPGFILRYLTSPNAEILWAVSASKFAYKKAVDRNYAKRRLRELFRLDPPKNQGYYLLSATPLTNNVSFEQLKKDYKNALSKTTQSS